MRNAVIALLLLFSSAELFVDEYVVLLHGLARTSASLNTMQEAAMRLKISIIHPVSMRLKNSPA
jgi:hypothetical protein